MDKNLNAGLQAAASQGIISTTQADTLATFLAGFGSGPQPADGMGLDQLKALDPPSQVEESEAPRFVRGFHDVLISLGILVVLAGVTGIGWFWLAIPAIAILAEIFVIRQRLALPAVVLTLWLLLAIAFDISWPLTEQFASEANPQAWLLQYLVVFPPVLLLFYARYRVPLMLAALLYFCFATVMAAVFFALSRITGDVEFVGNHGLLSACIFFASALTLFCLAMRFDLMDPARVTRRSDVAFWLHLGAAPSLLYAMLSFVFAQSLNGQWWGDGVTYAQAGEVVAIVALFMMIGLVIDRRAFVTSGLVSLGLAIWAIFQRSQVSFDSLFFVILLAVGIVVLTIGIGWQFFRKLIVGQLPDALKAKLPPVR